jgi:hypothetical protein
MTVAEFKALVKTSVTLKTAPNSVPPKTLGARFNELADFVALLLAAVGAGTNNLIADGTQEVISNGSSQITLAHPFLPGTVRAYRNGVRLPSEAFSVAPPTTVLLAFTPATDDLITIDYKYTLPL